MLNYTIFGTKEKVPNWKLTICNLHKVWDWSIHKVALNKQEHIHQIDSFQSWLFLTFYKQNIDNLFRLTIPQQVPILHSLSPNHQPQLSSLDIQCNIYRGYRISDIE